MQGQPYGFFFLPEAKCVPVGDARAVHLIRPVVHVGWPDPLPQERAKMAANAGREEKIYA
jgi:hypothetical protein